MTEVASLIVSAKFEGADKLKSDLNSVSTEAKKAEKSASQLSGAFTTLKTAIGAIAGSMIVREFVQVSDSMSLMSTRLKMTTGSMAEFAAQQKAMHSIARETHADIKDSYFKFHQGFAVRRSKRRGKRSRDKTIRSSYGQRRVKGRRV